MNEIVLAPFSNSVIRDWPAEHYRALIELLLARQARSIRLVGSATQSIRAAAIVRDFDATRVIDSSGRLAWPDVVGTVRAAAAVVGNNSGITHLASFLAVPTLCVFGGSHQRTEWRPMGDSATTLSRAIACSPCHLHRAEDCPYDRACLRQIAPETVADTLLVLLDDHALDRTLADVA